MSRRSLLLGAAGTAAAASLAWAAPWGSPRAAATGLVLPQPPATGISRGQVFDNSVPNKSVYAGLVYYVWGASTVTQPAGAVPSGYRPAFRDLDASHTLAWYQANHPDWVMYKSDRVTPAWEFNNTTYVPIDFTNPAVRSFYFSTQVQPLISAGYPMVCFDNVCTDNEYFSSGHFDASGNWVQLFNGANVDSAWSGAVLDWLDYLRTNLHAVDVGMAANITWNGSVVLSDIQQAVGIVDVYVDEQGFTVHRDSNYNDQAWLNKFNFARSIAATKLYLAINETTTPHLADASIAQVEWAIANYLLYREQPSMIALTGLGEYHVFLDRPELHTDIGAPTAAPVKVGTSATWQRSYDDGLVVVNPSSTATTTVTLGSGTWTDMHGTAFTGQIAMAPNRGTVLTHS